MPGWLLIVPLLLVRFGLLGLLDRAALGRAAAFAPRTTPGERAAYILYQLSSAVLLLDPLVLRVETGGRLFPLAGAVYLAGIAVLALSTVHFARPGPEGFCRSGLYRRSRNPMYVGYFLCFLGCALLTRSPLLLAALAVFQISAHWIVLSEERWCLQQFGDAYRSYMARVRRYL